MLKSASRAAASGLIKASRRARDTSLIPRLIQGNGITMRQLTTADANKAATTPPANRAQWGLKENEAGLGRWNWLLKALGFYSNESKSIRQSAMLYLSARDQAARPEFQRYLGVDESSSSRFYLECLHVWMILVRLRREGPAGKKMSQEIFDRFWEDITKQAIALNTRMRELQNVFYGCSVAYDYSLGNSDAILGAALYRNMYGHNCKAVHLNQMVAYVRAELHALEAMPTEEFLEAQWKFGNPLRTMPS